MSYMFIYFMFYVHSYPLLFQMHGTSSARLHWHDGQVDTFLNIFGCFSPLMDRTIRKQKINIVWVERGA